MIQITSKHGEFSIYAHDLLESYIQIENYNLLEKLSDDDEIILNEIN